MVDFMIFIALDMDLYAYVHVLSTAQRYSVYCQRGLNSLLKKRQIYQNSGHLIDY